jgi:3-oxoacyl-[acyl-carrier-protein] synthase II
MLTHNDPVVVTGLEVLSPLGCGVVRFREGLEAGRVAIRRITRFPAERYSTRWAAEIPDFDPAAVDSDYRFARLPAITQYGIAAAKGALQDARVELGGQAATDVGVLVAMTCGMMGPTCAIYSAILTKGPQSVNPLDFQNSVHNALGSEISIRLGLRAHNVTFTSGPSAAYAALWMASSLLRSGRCRQVLVVGAEELTETTFDGYDHLKTLSKARSLRSACCPFDASRSGMVLGEGAAAVVVETLTSARERGVPVYAEIAGVGLGHDAGKPAGIAADGKGLATAISAALAQGGVAFKELDFVCAAANSSRVLDAAEAAALARLGGQDLERTLVTSIKSMIGEAFSAGSLFNLAACLVGLQQAFVPATVHFESGDVDFPLRLCQGAPHKRPVNLALTNAMSFGGNHAAVLLRNVKS